MIYFTLKDFFDYRNPCWGCNKELIFEVLETNGKAYPTLYDFYQAEITLKNTYYGYPLKLIMSKSTHQLQYSSNNQDKKLVKNYLSSIKNQLVFRNRCPCGYLCITKEIAFDLDKDTFNSFSLEIERITLNNKDREYIISQNFNYPKCRVEVKNEEATLFDEKMDSQTFINCQSKKEITDILDMYINFI